MLARNGGLGVEDLARPQLGAAIVAILAGMGLWHFLHGGSFGLQEKILALGAICAIAAAETDLRMRVAVAERVSALLLAVTVGCMAAWRFL